MATNATLMASPREGTGKGNARKLRATGRVPAVIYGHGEETRLLSVDAHELGLLFSRIRVESTVIDVTVEGEQGVDGTALAVERLGLDARQRLFFLIAPGVR